MNLYFIVEFRRCLDLSSAPIGTCPSVMCNAYFHFQIKIRKISCRHTRSTKYPEYCRRRIGKIETLHTFPIRPQQNLGRSGNCKNPDRLGFSRHVETRLYYSTTTATPRTALIKKMLLYFTYEFLLYSHLLCLLLSELTQIWDTSINLK